MDFGKFEGKHEEKKMKGKIKRTNEALTEEKKEQKNFNKFSEILSFQGEGASRTP